MPAALSPASDDPSFHRVAVQHRLIIMHHVAVLLVDVNTRVVTVQLIQSTFRFNLVTVRSNWNQDGGLEAVR